MADYFDSLAQKFMNKSSLTDCSVDEIRKMVQQYPYFAPAHFLLLKKLDKNSDEYRQQYGKAILYYHNPLEFEQLFHPEKYETNFSLVEEYEPAEAYEEIGIAQDIAEAKPIEEISEEAEATSDIIPSEETKEEEIIYEPQEAEESLEPVESFHEEEVDEEIPEEETTKSIINFEEEENIATEEKQEESPAIEEEEFQPDTIEANSEEILFDKNALIDAAVEEMHEPESTVEIGTEEMPVDEYDIDEPEMEETVEEEKNEEVEERATDFNVEDHHEEEESVSTVKEEKDEEELKEEKTEEELAAATPEKENVPFEIKSLVDEPAGDLLFEPFHTVDYFASQGIKLSNEEAPQDKFGKQVKSFTEWLKTMKRLPAQRLAQSTDAVTEKKVETLATHSVADPDVITEAMAEVWIKQGNFEKATEVYNKLSLLNPSKRAYFAAKIENLNRS